jgi:Putative motility protein
MMDTQLVNAAVGMKQAETMSRIQVAVAKKVMDVDKMNGAAALKLLDAASQGVAQKGDALVAAATGLGGEIDTYA